MCVGQLLSEQGCLMDGHNLNLWCLENNIETCFANSSSSYHVFLRICSYPSDMVTRFVSGSEHSCRKTKRSILGGNMAATLWVASCGLPCITLLTPTITTNRASQSPGSSLINKGGYKEKGATHLSHAIMLGAPLHVRRRCSLFVNCAVMDCLDSTRLPFHPD